MSAINTNGLNVNYPVPGVNNNTQGFRDNFATIKTNFNITATEITDLQNKAIVKSALTGTSVNNDMGNTLISNALTRGFRASTNNLGNALVETVLVNVSAADVHYGSLAGNVTLQFAGWAPSGTQSNVQVILSTDSTNFITLPSQVDGTKETLINYVDGKINAPSDSTLVHLEFSTIDCGNTITVNPISYGRQTSQVTTREITNPVGQPGDQAGTVTFSNGQVWICTGPYDSITNIWSPIPGQGTVTSVGIAGGAGITVNNSPVTSSGTINVTNSGVLRANAGSGISIASTGNAGNGNVTITNTGVTGLKLDPSSNLLSLTSSTVANGAYSGVVTIGLASNIPNGTVTSVTVQGGIGIQVDGTAITDSGSVTVNNTGVVSLNEGYGIKLSALSGANVVISTYPNVPFANVSSATFTPNANSSGTIVGLQTGVNNITIPGNVFTPGTIISLYNNSNVNIFVNSGTGVTCWLGGTNNSTSPRTIGPHAIGQLLCVGTNTFVISGAGIN